jgi:hypothetical protein
LVTSFGEAKEVTRPPGRTPGLVVWQDFCFVHLAPDVTAKQQLPLKFDALKQGDSTTR